MRKNLFAAMTVMLAGMASFISCSNDEVGPGAGNQEVTHADSTTIVSLIYENFTSKDQVVILNADSTKISVSNDLLKKVNVSEVKRGNFVSVWQGLDLDPFYLRATNVQVADGRTIIEGSRSTAFEAFPNMEFKLSTDIYYNSSRPETRSVTPKALTRAGVGANLTSYEEILDDTLVIHPYGLRSEANESEKENGLDNMEMNPLMRSTNGEGSLIKDLVEEGLVQDDAKPGNWTVNGRKGLEFDITKSFEIPVYGGYTSNVKGSIWTNLIKRSREGLGEDANKNIAAKIRLTRLRLKVKAGINLYCEFSWLKPKKIELFTDQDFALGLDSIHVCGGVSYAGETPLLSATSPVYVFMVGPVPVVIQLHPQLVTKTNIQACVAVGYKLGLDTSFGFKLGAGWNSDKGMYPVNSLNSTNHFNVASFSNFLEMLGRGSAGLEGSIASGFALRCGVLLGAVAGPTFGMSATYNLKASVGADGDWDENGKFQGARPETAIHSWFALNAEIGGEMTVLGKTLWNRAWDIALKTWPIVDFNLQEFLKEHENDFD